MSDAVNQIVESQAKLVPEPSLDPKESVGAEQVSNKDEKVSSRIEMLIRREQQALARERIAKSQESEAQRLSEALKVDRERINKFNSIKSNPKLALEELGLTYDELTKAMLQDGEVPPEVEIKKLHSEIESIKSEREKEKQAQAEALKKQSQQHEEQAVAGFKGEIKQYINDNQARYELINFDEREDEVYELIDAHYTKTQEAHARDLELEGKDPSGAVGKVMKIAEAADKIEEYYEKRELEKKKLTKLQSLWGSVPKESLTKAVNEARQQQDKKPPGFRTLTNNLSATTQKPTVRPPNEDQRVAKIIADWKASRGG